MAGVYEENGQVKEAVKLLEEVVRIKGQTLAEDHPDRLASQHALAEAYRANGQSLSIHCQAVPLAAPKVATKDTFMLRLAVS